MTDEQHTPAHDQTKDLSETDLVEDLEPGAEDAEKVKGGDAPTENLSLNFTKIEFKSS
jgi:hypothetical protein